MGPPVFSAWQADGCDNILRILGVYSRHDDSNYFSYCCSDWNSHQVMSRTRSISSITQSQIGTWLLMRVLLLDWISLCNLTYMCCRCHVEGFWCSCPGQIYYWKGNLLDSKGYVSCSKHPWKSAPIGRKGRFYLKAFGEEYNGMIKVASSWVK